MIFRLLSFFLLIQIIAVAPFSIEKIPQTFQLLLSIVYMLILTIPLIHQYMPGAGFKWSDLFPRLDKRALGIAMLAAALAAGFFVISIKAAFLSLPEGLAANFLKYFLRPTNSAILNAFNDLAKSGLTGAFLAGILVLLLAATEELVFRGFIFTRLSRQKGTVFAMAASSILFGLIHIHPYKVAVQTIGGFIFAYAFLRTKTLLTPILAHWLFNCALLFFSTPLTLWLFR
jgi:membrane protease YdiL (CAAX protease family)